MAKLTDGQVRYLIGELAARLLTRAADPTEERRAALRRAIQALVPQVDEFELRELLVKVADGLNGMANLIEERRERQLTQGTAQKPQEDTRG